MRRSHKDQLLALKLPAKMQFAFCAGCETMRETLKFCNASQNLGRQGESRKAVKVATKLFAFLTLKRNQLRQQQQQEQQEQQQQLTGEQFPRSDKHSKHSMNRKSGQKKQQMATGSCSNWPQAWEKSLQLLLIRRVRRQAAWGPVGLHYAHNVIDRTSDQIIEIYRSNCCDVTH